VVFPGYEFTYHRDDLEPDFNHRCVVYPHAGGRLLRRIDAGSESDRELVCALRRSGAMAYPHHCSYALLDPAVEWSVEVCSSWRVCLEETNHTREQLLAGHKFGFLGSSDTHRAVPGLGGALTGIYAEELTPAALFDAYRQRRLIATQGFALSVDFRAAGVFLGGEGAVDGPPVELALAVRAPRAIRSIEVIRDGEAVLQRQPGHPHFEEVAYDSDVGPGTHFYYLRVQLGGEPGFNIDPGARSLQPFSLQSRYPHNLARARGVFAWTSPLWLQVGDGAGR
jgi:hypothetical protein